MPLIAGELYEAANLARGDACMGLRLANVAVTCLGACGHPHGTVGMVHSFRRVSSVLPDTRHMATPVSGAKLTRGIEAGQTLPH